jgi:hypothetical protein
MCQKEKGKGFKYEKKGEVRYLQQSWRLENSEPLKAVKNHEPPNGGYGYSNMFNWSCL